MAARKQKKQKKNTKGIQLAQIPQRLMRADLERRLPLQPKRIRNLTGRKFERCEVLGFAGFIRSYTAWLCRCNCGNLFVARGNAIQSRTTGCGCGDGRIERHGASGKPEYGPWYRMRRSHPGQVCRRWLNFANFRADVGPRPKNKKVLGRHNLRRPYGPQNAGWMTRGSASPGRGAKLYTFAGQSLAMKDWAKRIGITTERLRQRVEKCRKYGADIAQAFLTPAGKTMPCTTGRWGRPKKKSAARRK